MAEQEQSPPDPVQTLQDAIEWAMNIYPQWFDSRQMGGRPGWIDRAIEVVDRAEELMSCGEQVAQAPQGLKEDSIPSSSPAAHEPAIPPGVKTEVTAWLDGNWEPVLDAITSGVLRYFMLKYPDNLDELLAKGIERAVRNWLGEVSLIITRATEHKES